MSSDVQWNIVRQFHNKLIKRDGAVFSAEKGNLANKHSFKFSGFANKKIVSVDLDAAVKKPVLSIKRVTPTRGLVKNSFASTALRRDMIKGSNRSAEIIKKLTTGQHYRADLTKYAVARYHAIARSTKPVKPVQPKKLRGKKAQKSA